MKNALLLVVVALALAACGSVETGYVGIRTSWNGQVEPDPVAPGFYTAVTSHVDKYSIKEIAVDLDNMTPKAKDNLSLHELDLSVYYKVKPEAIRGLAVKYSGQSQQFGGSAEFAPAFVLVGSVARSEVASVISGIDSLVIHTQRDKVAADVKQRVQSSLDGSDPGVFTITRVVVRSVKTDETIENSIRNVVAKEKELEAAKLNVAVAHANAEANQQMALTLTPQFIQHEYNQVLMKFADHGGTVILDGSSSPKMLSVAN